MSTTKTIPVHHPRAVVQMIEANVGIGEARLWKSTEEILEQFLALKQGMPSLSDETAASLLFAAALGNGVQIAGL